jgi:hypothetical protein
MEGKITNHRFYPIWVFGLIDWHEVGESMALRSLDTPQELLEVLMRLF